MLPGQAYEEADLQQIHTKALNEADVALLADAWEVNCGPGCMRCICENVVSICKKMGFCGKLPSSAQTLNPIETLKPPPYSVDASRQHFRS